MWILCHNLTDTDTCVKVYHVKIYVQIYVFKCGYASICGKIWSASVQYICLPWSQDRITFRIFKISEIVWQINHMNLQRKNCYHNPHKKRQNQIAWIFCGICYVFVACQLLFVIYTDAFTIWLARNAQWRMKQLIYNTQNVHVGFCSWKNNTMSSI